MLAYTILLTVLTLVPGITGTFGALYLVSAAGLGAAFSLLAWRLARVPDAARAAVLFHFSLLYLALLFVAVAVDAALR